MVIQHNFNAADYSRRFDAVSSLQAQSFNKLSYENRTNEVPEKVADDAAELSISETMKKQAKGLETSATNAQESVSSVQTVEDALGKVHNMLQRMQDCAVAASDETKSKEERDVLQSEIAQISTEIDRVAESTKFNDTYFLNGSEGTKRHYPEAQDAGLEGKLTDEGTKATFEMKTLSPEDEIVIGRKEYTISYPAISYGKNMDYAALATDYAQQENMARLEKNKYSFGSDEYNEWDRREAFCRSRKLECEKLEQVRGETIPAEKAYEYMQEELTAANSIGTATKPAKVTTSVDEEQGTVTFSIEKGYTEGKAPLNLELQMGSDADRTNKIAVSIEEMSTAGLGLKGINVSDETGLVATYAKDAIANALARVSEQSTLLGEAKGKVENSISNLDKKAGNTDMDEKIIENAKKNILAQANEAMLAQANQMSQNVVTLLQV